MQKLPNDILDLIAESAKMGVEVESRFVNGDVTTLEESILAAVSQEEDKDKKAIFMKLSKDLKTGLARSHSNFRPIRAQFILDVTPDKMTAFLTLVPAKRGGKPLTLDAILTELLGRKIVQGVKIDAIETSLKKSMDRNEIVYSLCIAQATKPSPGEKAHIKFQVPIFDKKKIFCEKLFFIF